MGKHNRTKFKFNPDFDFSDFGKLAPHHADVCALRARGLLYREIAQALDIPIGTVRSRLNRARLKTENLASVA